MLKSYAQVSDVFSDLSNYDKHVNVVVIYELFLFWGPI